MSAIGTDPVWSALPPTRLSQRPSLGAMVVDLAGQVAREITDLHVEFERWFRGEAPDLARVEAALADDFTFVSPRGGVVGRAELLQGLRKGRGTRQIRIHVRNPTVRWHDGDAVLATYEEWHDDADYATGRLTTALFTLDPAAPGGLRWRHVHETWITPPAGWVVPPPR